ncbi:MAG: methyltransferase, partial [Betaproteobacteria bacterium]|nr:methyltransferase [Betaproteobacteria bacterium]
MHTADPGSFKDPDSRVYLCGNRVLRALTSRGAEVFSELERRDFFARWTREGKIIGAARVSDSDARALAGEGWVAVLEHPRVPFVSYPYEWPFAMLKDAALLHLDLLEEAVKNGWTFKDATPYNIQWFGARPVFIDIPSLQPRKAGELWAGYRQFCMNFLFPLMLKAHLNIDYAPLLRAELDGVSAGEMLRYFSGRHVWKKGVLPHVIFPALAEAAAVKREKTGGVSPKKPQQPDAIVLGLIRGLQNTVQKLSRPAARTLWSDYERTHSYGGSDAAVKKDFVRQN